MFQPFTKEEESLAESEFLFFSSPPHTKQSTGDKENFELLVYRQKSLAITARQMTRADRSASVRARKRTGNS